jgi:hypothetical protein
MSVTIGQGKVAGIPNGRRVAGRLLPGLAAITALVAAIVAITANDIGDESRQSQPPAATQAASNAAERSIDLRPVYALYVVMDQQRALEIEAAESELALAAMILEAGSADRRFSVLSYSDFEGEALDLAIRRIGNEAHASGARFELVDDRYR